MQSISTTKNSSFVLLYFNPSTPMQYLSANFIIPISSPPTRDAVLVLDDDGVVQIIVNLDHPDLPQDEIRHFDGVLCPGFVNTHCHLELSWAKGLIAEGKGLDYFVRQLELLKTRVSDAEIWQAIVDAACEMEAHGIIATADISNGIYTLDLKSKSLHYFHTFVEVFGSNPDYAEAVFTKAKQLRSLFETQTRNGTASITPHATYSLSEKLFRLVANAARENPLSIHHPENQDENPYFYDGSGPIAERRKFFNPDLKPFVGTGKRPFESISGHFDPGQVLLLVHNTLTQSEDIEFAEHHFANAYWCFCPNANFFIENQLPVIDLFRSKNCKITLGTDSLASNHQLSILEEMKTIQNHFPYISLPELLQWGTLNGARFMGIEDKVGSFEAGKAPGVVLLENIDLPQLKFTHESNSRLVIPAKI